MRRASNSGFALIEAMVVGSFLAVAALGLSGAMLSGITLEGNASETMDRIATAENMIEEMRGASQTNFNNLSTTYHDRQVADADSVGKETLTKRHVSISVSLKESDLPGGIDLNNNGKIDEVAAEEARILVIDIEGAHSLRLRTIVFDVDKMKYIVRERSPDGGNHHPVVFGEVREGGASPPPPEDPPNESPNEDPVVDAPEQVTITSAEMVGKGAEIALSNDTGESRQPTSMTIVPDKDSLYVGDVKINGTTVRPFDPEQAGGALNISIVSPIALAPGEGTISLGNFKTWDTKKSTFRDAAPGSITLTIGFDDGSTTTVVVTK